MSELPRRIAGLALLLVALALPLVLSDFWLQTGLFVMATAIGAVGLTLLVGVAGQLSLGHAAFAAIGAYVYAWSTGESTTTVRSGSSPWVPHSDVRRMRSPSSPWPAPWKAIEVST